MFGTKKLKFVLYGDKILLGRVCYHKDLLPENPNYSKIFGGGEFELDKEAKTITMFGRSTDFGDFHPDRVLAAHLPDNLKEYSRIIR